MKVWMLFIQGDGVTWLDGAVDDDTSAETDQWDKLVERAAKAGYAWRVLEVEVPGVYEAFEIPQVEARPT